MATSHVLEDGAESSAHIENPIAIEISVPNVIETDDLMRFVQNKMESTNIKSNIRKRPRNKISKSESATVVASTEPPEFYPQYSTIEIDDLISAFNKVEKAEINYKIKKKMKPDLPDSNKDSNPSSLSAAISGDEIEVDMIIRIPSSSMQQRPLEQCQKELRKSKISTEPTESVQSAEVLCSLEKLFLALKCENSIEVRCQGVFDLALLYLSEDFKIQPSDCFRAVQLLSDSHKNKSLAFSHAILLCSLTQKSMSWFEMQFLEDSIVSLAHSVPKIGESYFSEFKVFDLPVECQANAEKLCQKILHGDALNFSQVDTSAVLCTSLFNLSAFVKQYCCNIEEDYTYKEKTLKYIFDRTGNATQKIASKGVFDTSEKLHGISITSYIIKHCLHILEHALLINPAVHSPYLQHEAFSLPHCLTRLLAWSINSVFQEEQSTMDSEFHLSTLISLLKIFAVLTFNPNQYDSFTNVKGLMEKLMICILKAYFYSAESHFDVLVLCLELMINLFMKNRKTFILLCLKKFHINSSEEIPTIEALIKMLVEILDKIKEIKAANVVKECEKETQDEHKNPQSNVGELELQKVLQAAGKDMELSTIAAFICILIAFFMRTKENFMEFVRERLPAKATEEAVDVSTKVFEFATLTGGMPETGLMMLKYAISRLQKMR